MSSGSVTGGSKGGKAVVSPDKGIHSFINTRLMLFHTLVPSAQEDMGTVNGSRCCLEVISYSLSAC